MSDILNRMTSYFHMQKNYLQWLVGQVKRFLIKRKLTSLGTKTTMWSQTHCMVWIMCKKLSVCWNNNCFSINHKEMRIVDWLSISSSQENINQVGRPEEGENHNSCELEKVNLWTSMIGF